MLIHVGISEQRTEVDDDRVVSSNVQIKLITVIRLEAMERTRLMHSLLSRIDGTV